MSEHSFFMGLLRSSYVKSNNLTFNYNCVICSSCELILKGDYRFIRDHCNMESHKRKALSGGHARNEPSRKKLNIQRIQGEDTKIRYDITANDGAAETEPHKPHSSARRPTLDVKMELDARLENRDAVDDMFPVKKDNTLGIHDRPSQQRAENVGKEKSQTQVKTPKIKKELDNSQKLFGSKAITDMKPIKNDTCINNFKSQNVHTNPFDRHLLQQNNVSIQKDNVYYCETCSVELKPGAKYLNRHIKEKSHGRLLAGNMEKYFSRPKKYSEKQLFFHGMFELRFDLFYCKRCDLILDATDRTSVSVHAQSIDHSYALCRHLEKLYDDNNLSMRLEHNVSERICKALHPNRAPAADASKVKDDGSEVGIAAREHVNLNKSLREFNIPTSSKTKIDNRVVDVAIPNGGDGSLNCDSAEGLLKKLKIESPKPVVRTERKDEERDFADEVAMTKYFRLKGFEAVVDQSIVQNGTPDTNATESRFCLPELDPIILKKCHVTLSDGRRQNKK